MNNWYNRIAGGMQPQAQPQPQQMPMSGGVRFQNPMQRMQFIMNAMTNPVAFVREQFPDVPENISSNPDAVLNYLQRTRGERFTQQMHQVAGSQGGR